MNALAIKVIAALLIVAAIGFGVHKFLSYEQNIGYQKAVGEYAVKEKAARDNALEKERFLRAQVTEAEREAQKRDMEKRDAVAAAAASIHSLRDTLADQRHRMSTAPVDACRQTVVAALTVLGDCATAYGDLADKADGHVNDVKTLTEAWPR